MHGILVNGFEELFQSERRSRERPSQGYTERGLSKDIQLIGPVHGMSSVHHAWLLQSRRQCSAAGRGHQRGLCLFVCDQLCKLAYAGEVVGCLNVSMMDDVQVVIDVSVPEEPRTACMEQVDGNNDKGWVVVGSWLCIRVTRPTKQISVSARSTVSFHCTNAQRSDIY